MKRLQVLMVIGGALLLGACGESEVERQARQKTGGDPGHGAVLVRRYGCNACHMIPGVPGAKGKTGPTLEGIADRPRLAGEIDNTPQNLMRWIRDPQSVKKGTAMPTLGISEPEGRDLAAFLYTLK